MRCRSGEPDAPMTVVGTADQPDGSLRRGTEVTFLPSGKVFSKTEFDFKTIENRLRDLAYLDVRAKITISDRRDNDSEEVVLYL